MCRKLTSLFLAILLVVGLNPSVALASEAETDDLLVGVGEIDDESEEPVSLDGAVIKLAGGTVTYDGSAKKPAVKSVSVDGAVVPPEGYEVSYSNNVNAGKSATVTVTGVGDYEGTASKNFTIDKASASKFMVASISDKTYSGKAIKPTPKVTFNGKKLAAGTDYKLSYSSNKAAGKAKVTITGKGNFTGTKSVSFKILRKSLAKAKVSKISSKTYRGSAFYPTPKITVGGNKLKEGRDFELSYSNNLNAGTAKVKIKGVGNYKDSKTASFTIGKASLSSASISSVGSKKYTGSAIEPKPTVTWKGSKLKLGRDYVLGYSNNVNAGTATVTAHGIGNFSGTKATNFTIQAPAPIVVPVVSDTVYITNTGEKFHRDGCSSLRLSRIPISRADAIARGYEACKNCRP